MSHATMRNLIPNKQILYLFFCSVIILFVGMGLFPVLPLYTAQFGATRSVVGLYFAVMYAANAADSLLAGWLAARFSHKRLFVAVQALGVPALALIGQAAALWQVVALMSIVWFCGGMGIALINALTGLHADGKRRGRSFSLISLALPLGALFGGATVGPFRPQGGLRRTHPCRGRRCVQRQPPYRQ